MVETTCLKDFLASLNLCKFLYIDVNVEDTAAGDELLIIIEKQSHKAPHYFNYVQHKISLKYAPGNTSKSLESILYGELKQLV